MLNSGGVWTAAGGTPRTHLKFAVEKKEGVTVNPVAPFYVDN